MKIKSVLMSLLILATAYSCNIYEDLSDCPTPENLRLTFSYKGDNNDATNFSKMINRVTLYCFDESGTLIKTQTVEKSALDAFQGCDLYLPPGKYKIISWANAMADTEISGSTLASGRVHHPNYPIGADIPTNDHLYYGEHEVSVSAGEMATGDIPHRGAHINVEVHVSGVGFENDIASWPVVEITNLMPEYTMQMEDAQPYSTTYLPTVAWDLTHNTSAAQFCTLRFTDNNDIMVSIRKQNGILLKTISLKDFMISNNISVDGKNEATVAIMFKFYDGQFIISIPDWMQANVNPSI